MWCGSISHFPKCAFLLPSLSPWHNSPVLTYTRKLLSWKFTLPLPFFSGVESKHMLNVYRRKQGLLVFKPSAQERCVFCNPGDEDAVSMSLLMSSRTQNKPWKSCLLHCHHHSTCAWALHLVVSRWAKLHSKNVTKARGQPQMWSVQQDLY